MTGVCAKCPNKGDDPQDDSVSQAERTVYATSLSPVRVALILSTAWFGVFLGALDTTIIATLSAPISSEFNSLSLLSWLATSYITSNAACQPISGRLTDIFGRGPGLVFSNIIFALGNLICGLAPNQYAMIAGRFVAGIGGGGLMSIPTFLGSDLVPLRKRGVVGGIANIWYSCGAMAGGVFGGFIHDSTSLGWRLAFLIQVPPALLSAVAVMVLVKVPPKQSDKSYLARIDFVGAILTFSFLALLVLGLNVGGNLVKWTHPLPFVSIILSVILFITFIWWERRACQPIIPVKLLYNRTVLSACLTSFIIAMLTLTSILYIPLYLQVLGDSPTTAGLKILPASLGLAVGALGAGFIMRSTGKYVGLVISSIMVMTVGTVMFTFQSQASPAWITILAFFIVQATYSAVITVTQIACVASVDHSLQAIVTSTTYLARNIGSTIGMTMVSLIYQSILDFRLRARFGSYPNADSEITKIEDDLGHLQDLPPGWYDEVIESFVESFRAVWFIMLAWSILALICISPIKQHQLHTRLDRK
ncbi:major facilitator superfamily domain-containing protein [Thelonectria olida]|uniref:Major facilitator superfamily domain-containing protein n=1 Tax=Thelonectria olida TaxID=1576542 RepID=A0A9P8W2X9_9HYPO|nr:major facilitator superfamily domain-containing protein [Thelonectria olida]